MGGVGAPTGRSDPNSQFDLAHLAIWARRAPPGPATYLPHPTNGCPAWPSSQAACGKPGFAQGPLQGREIARDAIWGNLGHMLSMIQGQGAAHLARGRQRDAHGRAGGGTSRLGDALTRTPWQDHGRVAQGAASLATGPGAPRQEGLMPRARPGSYRPQHHGGTPRHKLHVHPCHYGVVVHPA